MGQSKIEWTESTWNPVTGCSKVSQGCINCYAERMAIRLHAMGQPNYKNGFEVTCHEHALELPFKWKKPQNIFVNSMGDLFHEKIPDAFIIRVFDVMNKANWHRYQVLTKRSERLVKLSEKLSWPKHIWMGVTVENEQVKKRINDLRTIPAQIKFLSIEPLLERMPELNLAGINWVIVGGESGPGARPIKEEWVIEIKNQCDTFDVPFFFKQWGGFKKKEAGRTFLGKTWDNMPELALT